MSLRKFLTSFTFFKNLFFALAIVVVILVVFVKILDFSTNHGEEITVANLSKMKLEVAEEKLDEEGLEVFLLDTVEFRPEFPPYTIVEQDPIAGSKVKWKVSKDQQEKQIQEANRIEGFYIRRQ